MRNYFILGFSRIIGTTIHDYIAARTANDTFSGNYVCDTLLGEERTKIATDFICMPNSSITGIRDNNRRLEFRVGETTQQGRISIIRLNNRRVQVLLNNARTTYVDMGTLTKIVPLPIPAHTPAAVRQTEVSLSRSTDPFITLQEKIATAPDIRLEKLLKKNIPSTLKDFLITFFKTYNVEKNTIFVNDKTKIQTATNRRRSLGDIYKLCKYYYPTCTLKEVLTLLYVTLPVSLKPGFRTSLCSQIKKRVWYYAPTSGNGVYDTDSNDEYGNKVNYYTSKL